MHIRVERGGDGHVVTLEQAADCSRLEIEAVDLGAAEVTSAVLGAGAAIALEGDGYLISVPWLRAHAGPSADDPAWADRFASMVEAAQGGRYLADLDALPVGPARARRQRRGPGDAAITGVALTPFGNFPGVTAIEWQARAAVAALADANRSPAEIDGLLVGYATTIGHLMPANLLAEYLGIHPCVALGVSVGGATGLAMLAQAVALIRAGSARCVLVVAGEDRASGQSRERSLDILAQVGERHYEVPLGATIPAYYALLASAYLHRYGLAAADLAPLAVQMRANASGHPGAQFRTPVEVTDVLASRPIAEPLRLLDCCPVSDGGAAFVVEAPTGPRAVEVVGLGQAHRHQHVSEADEGDFGARRSSGAALAAASLDLEAIDIAGIYDSFTVTLALLLEEIGFVPPGKAGAVARQGEFGAGGILPLNTHGGLLSYGHSGVAGGMAHVVEVVTQLRGEAGSRQIPGHPRRALVHADGGVLSAHVTAVLERGFHES